MTNEVEVAIIGAGPGGIAAAYHLQQHGISDFLLLERADNFGGTWRDNHYPGLAVDIPGVWYQLPFARNPNWSRLFPTGPEIHRYLHRTAEQLGLYPHLRPHTEVVRQTWQQEWGRWRLDFADGSRLFARFVISAIGGYINAKESNCVEGMQDFEGTILRPNAWDDEYDAADTRVAIIGTGSSGVQIAAALVPVARTVDVYQRTPGWILPKIDFDIPPALQRAQAIPGAIAALNWTGRTAMDVLMVAPILHGLSRLPATVTKAILRLYDKICRLLYRFLLLATVRDRGYRKALLPRYGILAKRPVISSAFFPALNHDSVRLITTPIRRVTRHGVLTVDGVEHPADLIVMATGYELYTDPESYRTGTVIGRDGFDMAREYHIQGLRCYAGTAHPKLPNRWELVGPQGFVGLAWTDFVDTTARHAVRIIAQTRHIGADVVQVTEHAFDRWNDKMRKQGKAVHLYTTECNAGLRTYFINSHGEALYYRPQTIRAARRFARRSPLTDYTFTRITPTERTTAPGHGTHSPIGGFAATHQET